MTALKKLKMLKVFFLWLLMTKVRAGWALKVIVGIRVFPIYTHTHISVYFIDATVI